MKNKAQARNIIIFGVILGIVLVVGLVLSLLVAVITWTVDEIVPAISNEDWGTYGENNETNLTQITATGTNLGNSIVQTFSWLVGVGYFLVLVFMFGLAFAFRVYGDKWIAVFYIMMLLLLVIASIFVSNIYYDFLDDDGELGNNLREQTLMSWLVVYSPIIFTVIGFVSGIIMFTGENQENYV